MQIDVAASYLSCRLNDSIFFPRLQLEKKKNKGSGGLA
jgi:hypothetical protein